MKIEPGYYKTRDGRKARVLCVDAPDRQQPAIGFIYCTEAKDGLNDLAQWCLDGTYERDRGKFGLSDQDLIEPWTEPKRKVKLWPSVYRASDGKNLFLLDILFASEHEAREYYGNSFIRLAAEYPAIEVEAPE